jgi:signal peptidase I
MQAITDTDAHEQALSESAVRREPWVAVIYSLLIPGLGQWYAGAMRNAALYFVLVTGLFGAGVFFMFSPHGSTSAALACMAVGFGFFLGGMYDAFDKSAALNGEQGEAQRKMHKDPWLAVFLSLLIPGVGQIFNLRIVSGIVFLGLWLGAGKLEAAIHSSLLTWYLLALFTALVAFGACLHAWHSAPGLRPAQSPIRTLAFVVVALALLRGPTAAYGIKSHLAVAFQCRTGGMQPTVQPDDRLFAAPAHGRAPQRGDLVMFLPPESAFPEPSSGPVAPFFKRVIAVPGDSVTMQGRDIFVNGIAVTRDNGTGLNLNAIRSLGSKKNRVSGQATGVSLAALASGQVFVVGDNLANSFDSRNFGPVPVENLRAYPYKVYWPPERAGAVE